MNPIAAGLALLLVLLILAPFALRLRARKPLRVTREQLDEHITHRIDAMHRVAVHQADSTILGTITEERFKKHEMFHRELRTLLRTESDQVPYEDVVSRLNEWTRTRGPNYSSVELRQLELVDDARSKPTSEAPRSLVNDTVRSSLDLLAVVAVVILAVVGLIALPIANAFQEDSAEAEHARTHSENLWSTNTTEPLTSASVGEDGQLHVITRGEDDTLSVSTLPADEVVIREIADGSSPRMEHQSCRRTTDDERAQERLDRTGSQCLDEDGGILLPTERYLLHIERGSLSTP